MAKPQIKKVKKDSKGVTYYFSDDDGIMCVDIDVEPGVKSVVFQERQCASKWKSCYSRFLLRNVKKQFPDVERLIISGECIYTIDISNMMFPNVKEVIVKDNDSYEPGPYLMTAKDTNDGRKFCLLNTFCSDAGSVIDLKDVTEISSYAFEGCMAGKIINCKDVLIIDNSSFCGYPASMCENSYKDGALVFENMLVDIDAGAEHVTISEEVTISTSKWFNLSNVKEIVFQKMSTIPLVNGPNFNGTITINDDSFIPAQRDIDKIIRHIHCSAFKVTESNKQICAVDGVIYVKQDTALELYHLTGKQFYKDFLKKSKNSIIKRYFDRGQEKEIIDFLQFGFFASSSLDKFRKIADEREMSILSAYILEEQKKKAPKTTTKFTI